jgi:signal transduction histidine kinase
MEATGSIIKRLKEILGDDRCGSREQFRLHEVISKAFRHSRWCAPGQCSFAISGMDGMIADADPGDLAAILEELIGNTAVHGRLDDGSLPTVSVETAVDDGLLIISYEDDGKGVGDGEIDRLTDPFYTTARSTGGKGLGLAVVRSIVEIRNHGDLALEAKDSGGLRIILSLPWTMTTDS